MIWFFGQPCWSYGFSATLTCSHSYMFRTDTHITTDLLRPSTETCFCPHPSLQSRLIIWYSCIVVCTEPSSKTLTKLSWPLYPQPLPQTYDACQITLYNPNLSILHVSRALVWCPGAFNITAALFCFLLWHYKPEQSCHTWLWFWISQ